jgi:pilus assembly protein CpaC
MPVFTVFKTVRHPNLHRLAREVIAIFLSCAMPIAALSGEAQSGRGDAGASSATASSQALGPELIHLYVGQTHVLNEANIRRIAVGNGKVLQATALDEKQVLIIPEAAGQSTVHLWGKSGGERHYVVNVVTADTNRLLTEVRALIGPQTNVKARLVGDKVVIEGGNLSEEQAGRLSEVSKRYPQIVNLMSRVGLERMIAMDVRFVEIRRDALHNLGVKWGANMSGPTFGVIGDFRRGNAFRPGGPGITETTGVLAPREYMSPASTALGISSWLGSTLNLMAKNGEAMILAEPRLSCRSGGSARFVAGGELPIPYSTGLGATSVIFKEYGIKFDVSPVASESGVIAAKIATEISAIDPDVKVNNIPGLLKRRAETDVNLRENETLVIAGLLSDEGGKTIDKVPGLGDVPILGRLFKSKDFQSRQTELVVFMTPRFISPDNEFDRQMVTDSSKKVDSSRQRIKMVD